MKRVLPGSAKYYKPLAISLPCSVLDCREPAHFGYRTATAHQFCMTHRQRYQLVELAQRLFSDGYMTNQDDVKLSCLQGWINLALFDSDEAVKQRLDAHKDDCIRWHIDEAML